MYESAGFKILDIEGYSISIIGINPRNGNDRSFQVSADIFDGGSHDILGGREVQPFQQHEREFHPFGRGGPEELDLLRHDGWR